MTALREEFIVCYAPGYPDPFHCETLAEARSFVKRHNFDHSIKLTVVPVIKRRWASNWEEMPYEQP
jgi:hypothetical protein